MMIFCLTTHAFALTFGGQSIGSLATSPTGCAYGRREDSPSQPGPSWLQTSFWRVRPSPLQHQQSLLSPIGLAHHRHEIPGRGRHSSHGICVVRIDRSLVLLCGKAGCCLRIAGLGGIMPPNGKAVTRSETPSTEAGDSVQDTVSK